jgi:D-alanine-D-alanine ligase
MNVEPHEDDEAAAQPTAAPAPRPPRRTTRVIELEQQIERLTPSLRIAVVYGGDKTVDGAVINPTPNTRPWKSYEPVAEDIAQALRRLGFNQVFLMPEDMRLGDRLRREGIHLAWLNTGGVQGYNPMAHAAAMMEMYGIPYIGHDPLTTGVLDNKHVFKRSLAALDIRTAPFMTWHPARGPFQPKANGRFIRTFKDHWGPFVVKPVSGRGSLHVHVIERESDLSDAIAEVFAATENHVLIEAYLPGREFCVAACGSVTARGRQLGRRGEPFVFAAVERVLAPGEKIFTSMDVAPITADRLHVLNSVSDMSAMRELHELSRKVFVELHLKSLVRLDVRVDAAGRMCILEANPKPDLRAPSESVTSLVCAGLAEHGMDYDDLILSLLADRLDLLFSQRRGTASQLSPLLQSSSAA